MKSSLAHKPGYVNLLLINFQAEVPEDIYPNCKVEDLKNGIIGSCSTYNTRKNVTDLIRPLQYGDVEERCVCVCVLQ